MAVFSNRDEIANKTLKYLALGYTVKETLECFPVEKEIDEDKLYNLIKNVYDKARKAMTPEEWSKIVEVREARKNNAKKQIYQEVADDVKTRVDKADGFRQKALTEAVSGVAKSRGLNSNFVRDCTKMIYPEFYKYCREAEDVTPEYMLDMANSIIKQKLHKSAAEDMPYYSKMRKYIKANYPELYKNMNDVFI